MVTEFRRREHLLRRDYGHDVRTVSPPAWDEGGSLVRAGDDPDVPVYVVDVHGPPKPNLFWYDLRQLRRVIRQIQPELVDLHEEPYSVASAGVLLALRLERLHVPFCVYSAQNIVNRRYPPPFSVIERAVLARAGAAFPCSSEAGERLRLRGYRGPVHVLPLGVEPVSEAQLDIRLEHEATMTRPPLRVGFIGRLEPSKGGVTAVRAFALAARLNLDLKLEVIGAGAEASVLRAEAERLGIGGRVAFRGALPQDETLERLDELQVVLMPSVTTATWKEQYGRVAAQAMSRGAAVIASDSGSLAEVLGDAGILVPEGDVDAMASALGALAADRQSLTNLRRRARERAARELSWDAVATGVDTMYRELTR